MWQSEKKSKETQGLVRVSGKKEKGKLIGGFQAVGKDGGWYSYFFQCRWGGPCTCSHSREQVHGNGGEWAGKMWFTGSKIGLKRFAGSADAQRRRQTGGVELSWKQVRWTGEEKELFTEEEPGTASSTRQCRPGVRGSDQAWCPPKKVDPLLPT